MVQLRNSTKSLLTSAACLLIMTAQSAATDILRGLQLPDEIIQPELTKAAVVTALATEEPAGLFVQVPLQKPKSTSLMGSEAKVARSKDIKQFIPKYAAPKITDELTTGSISKSHAASIKPTQMFGQTHSHYASTELNLIVASSLVSSDKVKASMADENAASTRVWRAWAAFAPTVTATAFIGREPNSSSSLVSNPSSIGHTMTVSAKMGLLDGGQRFYGVRSALSNARAAAGDVRSTRDRVALETVNAVLERDYAAHQSIILRESVSNLRQLIGVSQSRFQAGLASNSDIADVQAELVDAQRNLTIAEASENKARVTLEGLLGSKAPQGLLLPNLDQIASKGESALVMQALKSNPSIQSAWHRYDAADFNSRAAMGRYLPKLDLVAEHKTSKNFTSSTNNGWTLGAQFSMPLVELTTVAEIAESRYAAQAARYRAQDRGREVQTQVSVDWQEFNSATAKVTHARKKITALRSGLASKQEQYRVGLIPVDQLLTQTRRVAQARIEDIEARSGRYASLIRIAANAGILNEVLQKSTAAPVVATGSIKTKAAKIRSKKQDVVQTEPVEKPLERIAAAK